MVIADEVSLKILMTVSFVCPLATEPKFTVSGTKSPPPPEPEPPFELGEVEELHPASIEDDTIVAKASKNKSLKVIMSEKIECGEVESRVLKKTSESSFG